VKRAPYALVFAVVCGGCSFEASCGKKSVKTREFEGTIKERTAALGLNPTKVDCGEPVEAKVGVTFVCKIELDGEKTYDMNVAVTGVDEKAERVDLDPTWAGGNAVVAKKIEEGVSARLAERFGAGVTLDCGEPLRFVPDDDRFTCDLVSGTYKGKATLIFADGTTNLDDVPFESNVLGKTILEGILTPSVREKTSPAVVVTCGDQAMIPRPADGVIWCDIADSEQKAKIKVVVDEQNNVARWDVADPPK
jgi:hypothetical protein